MNDEVRVARNRPADVDASMTRDSIGSWRVYERKRAAREGYGVNRKAVKISRQ